MGQACCALTGDGLLEGLEWMASVLQNGSSLASSPACPLPVMPGAFEVAAESLKVWTGKEEPPLGFKDNYYYFRDASWDIATKHFPRGTSLKVVKVVDRRENLMGVCCRAEEPEQVWFDYVPGDIEPASNYVVSLQCVQTNDRGTTILCYSLSGAEIGRYQFVDAKQQTIGELASFVSGIISVGEMQLQFVLGNGKHLPGFPGTDLLSHVLHTTLGAASKCIESI